MAWDANCLAMTISTGKPPAGLGAGVFLKAASAAAAAWSHDAVSCNALRITVQGDDQTKATVANDGKNRVMFRQDVWCKNGVAKPVKPGDCYGAEALAMTTVWANPSSGEIRDADVEVNALHFRWADLVAGGPERVGAQDLQNALTHEFGHFIGLDHSCYSGASAGPRPIDHTGQPAIDCGAATEEQRKSSMFPAVRPGDIQRRTLSTDDKLGACDLYPQVADGVFRCVDSKVEGVTAGGCAVAGDVARPSAGPIWVALTALGLWSRRRRRR